MAARTGLFVAPVPGSPPVGTSPTDGRLVHGALFGTTAGCIAGGGLTSSGSVMQLTIAAATWRIPDPTNAAAVSLSPADPATLSFAAGPASGSRIDVAWVRQNNYEAGDADSRVTYGVAAGTAGSSPTTPSIPAGAMKVATVTVPTGVSNLAACTVVAAYPQTRLPLDIAVPTTAQLPAAGEFYGQRATIGTVEWRWNGTAWKAWDSDWSAAIPTVGGLNGGYGGSPGYASNGSAYRYVAGQIRWRGQFYLNGGAAAATSQLTIGAPVAPSTAAGAKLIGKVSAFDASDTNAEYALGWTFSGSTLYLGGAQNASGKYGSAAMGTTPFGSAWTQSDAVEWDLIYDPA